MMVQSGCRAHVLDCQHFADKMSVAQGSIGHCMVVWHCVLEVTGHRNSASYPNLGKDLDPRQVAEEPINMGPGAVV